MEDSVKLIMADIFMIDQSEIGTRTTMETLEQWDSLAQIDLVAALEEEFGVQFEVEDFESMTDFPKVLNTLAQKL